MIPSSPAPAPAIQVGTLAVATRDCSPVCRAGEHGVCYEVYELAGRPGYAFIFERGGYDGFSPDDVALCLTITGAICRVVEGYQFKNVMCLQRDFDQGRFAPAFPPRQSARPAWEPL